MAAGTFTKGIDATRQLQKESYGEECCGQPSPSTLPAVCDRLLVLGAALSRMDDYINYLESGPCPVNKVGQAEGNERPFGDIWSTLPMALDEAASRINGAVSRLERIVQSGF